MSLFNFHEPVKSQYNPTMKLKLIINKHTQQFLFAEADETFVNFLFTIPSLPLGTFLNLFTSEDNNPYVVEGSLGNLYRTIENFDGSYDSKINDHPSFVQTGNSQLFPNPNYAINNSVRRRMLNDSNIHSVNLLPRSVVKAARYMVMDDLSVEPMTLMSSLHRLNMFGVSDVKDLEEKEVVFGRNTVVNFLKELYMTKNVLSSVFLGNKYKDCDDANDYVMTPTFEVQSGVVLY